MTKNVTFLSPTILYPNFIFRNIESFNEAEAEAKAGESELTQDGDEPLLAELKQQDFQPEKFGSGHAETNNGNDSIILFESAVEKPIEVILPNTTIIKENSEETIETDQGMYIYDLLTSDLNDQNSFQSTIDMPLGVSKNQKKIPSMNLIVQSASIEQK